MNKEFVVINIKTNLLTRFEGRTMTHAAKANYLTATLVENFRVTPSDKFRKPKELA